MNKMFSFFIKGKNNVSYSNNIFYGIVTIVFVYLSTEIVLWVTLNNMVANRGLLALMLFGFCNLMLFAGGAFYLWVCKNYGQDIERLLPTMNRYHHVYFSLQDEILMDYILSQILKGNSRSNNYEEYFKNNANCSFFDKEHRIVIFVPENDYDSINEAFSICNSSFHDIAKDKLTIYALEVDNMLAAICFPKNQSAFHKDNSWLEMTRYLQYVQVKVEEKLSTHLYAAAGGRHMGLGALRVGFSEAMDAYEYQRIYEDEGSLIFYNNIKYEDDNDNDIYKDDAWFEMERRLLYEINIGDLEQSDQIISELIELIGTCHHISFQAVKYKVFGLINSLYIDLLKHKDIENELLNINAPYFISNCKSIVQLQGAVNIIYTAVKNEIRPLEDIVAENHRIQEIVAYIKTNYSNTDLNIVYVADQFQLTPAYLSRIFKKEMKIGPAEYLQKVRLEAAKKLLLHTETTVKDVSEIVGYQYVLTMNRAFKKYEGITPTEFVSRHKGKI